MTTPQLAQAARRLADQQTSRFAALPDGKPIIATVTAVTPGAAQDGNATITVTWYGTPFVAAGWNRAQTFTVGDRVVCEVINNQVLVGWPIAGQP